MKLLGTLESEKTGKNTRSANLIIETTLQSPLGAIAVSLNASGMIQIKVGTERANTLLECTDIQTLLKRAAHNA